MSQPNRKTRKSSVVKVVQHRLSNSNSPSYVRELEFPADGPGRVIVRLERLMGSDRIRITDTKYMTTLLQRLGEEEEINLRKRSRERRKAEHNRFRQLVIDGYTEPTPAMQDLYNHPVFRVNRILARLTKLGNSSINQTLKLPPIVPVDPFEYDDTGRVFKTYPGHFPFAKRLEQQVTENASSSFDDDVSVLYSNAIRHDFMEHRGSMTKKKPDKYERYDRLDEDDAEEEEEDEEDEDNMEGEFFSKLGDLNRASGQDLTHQPSLKRTSGNINPPRSSLHKPDGRASAASSIRASQDKHLQQHLQLHSHVGFSQLDAMKNKSIAKLSTQIEKIKPESEKPQVLTLREIQQIYGVAPDSDLGAEWKPYQSPIVEVLFEDEERGVSDLYEMGTLIVDMFDRQQQTTEDYIKSITKPAKNENEVGGDEEEEELDALAEDIRSLAEIGEFYANLSAGEDADEEDDDNEPDLEDRDPLQLSSSKQADIEGPPTWDNFEEELWEAPDEQEEEEDTDRYEY